MSSKKNKECAICGRGTVSGPVCKLHSPFTYFLVRQDGEWKISERGMQVAEAEGIHVRCAVAE